MKKRLKGPTWKKGQVSLPPVYHPPVVLDANLTEEQKKWPRSDLVISPATGEPPPQVEEREPNPKAPPAG